MDKINWLTSAHAHFPMRVSVHEHVPADSGALIRIHPRDTGAHLSSVDIYMHKLTPAELAAWKALSDALAAQDVVEDVG